MGDRLVVHVRRIHLLLHFADPRQHPHDALEIAHFSYLGQLITQVLEGELAFQRPLGDLLRLLGIDGLLGLLDQPNHVTHAENTAGNAVRLERLEIVEFFPDAHQLDRTPGDRPHGERRAAPAVTVHPCQDDARQSDPLVEGFGGSHRVLTGKRVGDQQGFHRHHLIADDCGLDHEFVIDRQTTGGIENDHIETLAAAHIHGPLGDPDRLLAEDRLHHLGPHLLTQGRQLLRRGRTRDVEGRQQHFLALPVDEPGSDFGAGRGLARTLKTNHHQRRRRLGRQVEAGFLGSQHFNQPVVDDLDHHLARRDALEHLRTDRGLGDLLDELLNDGQRDIRFQQGHPHLAHGFFDIGFVQRAPALQTLEDVVKPAGQTIEHGPKSAKIPSSQPKNASARNSRTGGAPRDVD